MLADPIDLNLVRRVLVTKLRHHGDVLLASPVLTVLKNHLPHAEVDALVYADTAEMLSLHPALSRLQLVDRGWKRRGPRAQWRGEVGLLRELAARRYDLLVHLTEHPRGAWLRRLLRIPHAVAPAREPAPRGWRGSFTHLYAGPRGTFRHTVEQNLDALRRIGVYPHEDERALTLVPGTEAEAAVDLLLERHGLTAGGFVHVHPTSRWMFKAWPAARVAECLTELRARGHPVVLTAAPDAVEMRTARDILAAMPEPAVDLSGRLSLKQLAALAARARLFVGVDSAPMHIAAAVGTPVVALFGPSGEGHWGPWRVPHRVVSTAHPCRPCGRAGCGDGRVSECLTELPVAAVLAAAEGLLAATGGRAGAGA